SLGRRYAGHRHDELHDENAVPRLRPEPPRRRADSPERPAHARLPLYDRGSRHVGSALDRRISVAYDRREAIRIRLPRRQLLARRDAAWRAAEGSRRRRGEKAAALTPAARRVRFGV